MQIFVYLVFLHNKYTQSGDSINNEAKIYLAFGYRLPTSLLNISHVKSVFNHWSGEVGRSGLRLHFHTVVFRGKLVCESKFFDTPKSAHSLKPTYLYRYNPNGPANCRSWFWQKLQRGNLRRLTTRTSKALILLWELWHKKNSKTRLKFQRFFWNPLLNIPLTKNVTFQ